MHPEYGYIGSPNLPLRNPNVPLQNLAWLDADGNVQTVNQQSNSGLLGSSRPPIRGSARLMNLESTQEKSLDVDLGTTEYVLISMWFAFTAGVFGLLYKITKEADEECDENIKRARGISVQIGEENLA